MHNCNAGATLSFGGNSSSKSFKMVKKNVDWKSGQLYYLGILEEL